MLLVDLKFENDFCVELKAELGVKFWFELDDIRNYVLVLAD